MSPIDAGVQRAYEIALAGDIDASLSVIETLTIEHGGQCRDAAYMFDRRKLDCRTAKEYARSTPGDRLGGSHKGLVAHVEQLKVTQATNQSHQILVPRTRGELLLHFGFDAVNVDPSARV